MKRRHGHMLLWAGFFGASLTALYRGQDVPWGWYLTYLVVGVAGVVILRLTAQGDATHEHKVGADLQAMRASLAELTSRLHAMTDPGKTIEVYRVHGAIDDELAAHLATFADARESMIPLWGLDAYADVMTRFAGAERLINRAWSASADGYEDEVRSSLERARDLMDEARAAFESKDASGAASGA